MKSPVLFLIFNRPDTTCQVFEQVRKARPGKLYIAADGPRSGNISDIELCRQARLVTQKVDWDCNVRTFFSDENKGCKAAVSTAINWFFDAEEEGVILEDDCLPSDTFFYFCDAMLERYRFDSRVSTITGTNLQDGKKWGTASYYFSQFSNIW